MVKDVYSSHEWKTRSTVSYMHIMEMNEMYSRTIRRIKFTHTHKWAELIIIICI